MDEMIEEFKQETREIIEQNLSLLEEIEEDLKKIKELEGFAQTIDRVMGGALSLSMAFEDDPLLNQIGSCAKLCKIVGYRGSQIEKNPPFAAAVVGLLMDMIETLESMVDVLGTGEPFDLKSPVFLNIVDRLEWVATQFKEGTRSTMQVEKTKIESEDVHKEVMELLNQFGIKT